MEKVSNHRSHKGGIESSFNRLDNARRAEELRSGVNLVLGDGAITGLTGIIASDMVVQI